MSIALVKKTGSFTFVISYDSFRKIYVPSGYLT